VADTVGHSEGTSTYADAYSGILSERPPIIPAYRLVFVWVHNHVCVATHQQPRKDARRGRCHLLESGFWPLWMTPLPRNYSHKSQVTSLS